MPEENLALVRRLLEGFNQGDLDALLSDMDPEIEWHDQRELPGATIHFGRDATIEHLRAVLRELPGYRLQPDELVDAGANIVLCGRAFARGRASAVPVDRPIFAVYTAEGGRVRSVRIFGTRAEALAAAGVEA